MVIVQHTMLISRTVADMMRAQLIVMALAMLFLLIAVLIGGVGCMKKSSGTIKLGAVFSVLGGRHGYCTAIVANMSFIVTLVGSVHRDS